jgi:hypothetical protein
MSLTNSDGTSVSVGTNVAVTAASVIYEDAWNYGQTVYADGAIGLGPTSPAMTSVLTDGYAGWFMETGYVQSN